MSVVGLVSPQAYRGVAGSLRLAFLHAFMPVFSPTAKVPIPAGEPPRPACSGWRNSANPELTLSHNRQLQLPLMMNLDCFGNIFT
jgi:hypothetical protein